MWTRNFRIGNKFLIIFTAKSVGVPDLWDLNLWIFLITADSCTVWVGKGGVKKAERRERSRRGRECEVVAQCVNLFSRCRVEGRKGFVRL